MCNCQLSQASNAKLSIEGQICIAAGEAKTQEKFFSLYLASMQQFSVITTTCS